MKHLPRHEEILKIITRLRSISVQDLTTRLKVSEVTIRKDLNLLEEMGFIIRSHGGARLAEDARTLRTLNVRKNINIKGKKAIAVSAVSLIREEDTIYIDSGSTCKYLAEQIKGMYIRVITNSLDVMNILAEESSISLVSLGGNYRKEAGSFLGPLPIETLKNFRIETSFLGVTGLLSRGVFSSQNILESQLKQQVLNVSERRVILADSTKFGHSAFSIFARAGDVDILITDSAYENSEDLNKIGIEVILAK
jgi:DeoR family transcriptional regulator, aga operon transcriptional repressor